MFVEDSPKATRASFRALVPKCRSLSETGASEVASQSKGMVAMLLKRDLAAKLNDASGPGILDSPKAAIIYVGHF